MENKMSNKKLIFNILFMVIFTVLIFNFILKGEDRSEIFNILSTTDKGYIFLGIILSLIFVFGEGMNIKNMLKMINLDIPLIKTIKYAFTGFFFSGITPSASGGQPMQIYEMNKDGIDISKASLALLLELVSTHIISFLYGIIGFIWFKDILLKSHKGIMLLIIIGLLLKVFGIIFILFSIFNSKISMKILNFTSKIIIKLPILKTEQKNNFIENLKEQVLDYNKCAKYIKNKKNTKEFLKVLLMTIVQMGSFYSISYIVYRALGNNSKSLLDIVFLQALIETGASYIPLPGGVGVNESSFLAIFKGVYSKEMLSSAMLLSRGISFYLLMIISIIFISIAKINSIKELKELKNLKVIKKNYSAKEIH